MSILLEKIVFSLYLITPPILFLANDRLSKVRRSSLLIASISFIIIYCLLQFYVHLIDIRFNAELDQFDLNKDGWFSGEEINPAQEKAMQNVTYDTARTFAPYTGIVTSALYVLFVAAFFALSKRVWQFVTRYRANRL